MDKPTVKQIEEYMAALNIPEEQRFTQGLNGTTASDLYDVISKPKHYMLFEEQGIEVRDVIEKLIEKLVKSPSLVQNVPTAKPAPLFTSDYVQLMQYLMRFMDKNGKEDLEKARFYLDKMISAY